MTLWVGAHLPAKFGGDRHCGSGDMFLVSHLMLHDVTKRSRDFMGGSSHGK